MRKFCNFRDVHFNAPFISTCQFSDPEHMKRWTCSKWCSTPLNAHLLCNTALLTSFALEGSIHFKKKPFPNLKFHPYGQALISKAKCEELRHSWQMTSTCVEGSRNAALQTFVQSRGAHVVGKALGVNAGGPKSDTQHTQSQAGPWSGTHQLLGLTDQPVQPNEWVPSRGTWSGRWLRKTVDGHFWLSHIYTRSAYICTWSPHTHTQYKDVFFRSRLWKNWRMLLHDG